jgi:opacity protein-like surface antigen
MIRRVLAMGASAAAMALAASSAIAGPTGWYISLEGGVNIVRDADITLTNPPGSLNTEFDTGWAVMGAVGYRWDSNWRLEFELAFRENDFETLAPAAGTGQVTQFSQMLNAVYDIDLTDRLSLGLGAGVGGVLVSMDSTVLGPVDDDYTLAGQLIAQLNYRVAKRLDLFLDARFFVASNPDLNFGVNRVASFSDDKLTFMIGLRYDLSPEAEAPPPPQPLSPPPPPPVAKQYIVFFGWNKSNLTAQAQATVAQAAATAKQIGSASILVVGHTDTSGGARYNQRLSERRANTVANELVRNGITPESISAMGKGETELLIQTGDSMREPQNRRVEINL